MKQILSVCLLSILIFVSACTKTATSPTQGALTAQKLISVLGTSSGTLENGRVIYANNNAGYLIYTATTYNISSDGYITLSSSNQNTYTYNLTFLKGYSVYEIGTNNIRLDFSF